MYIIIESLCHTSETKLISYTNYFLIKKDISDNEVLTRHEICAFAIDHSLDCAEQRGWQPCRQLQLFEVKRNNFTQGKRSPEAWPEEWKLRCDELESTSHCLQRGWQLLKGGLFLNRVNLSSFKLLGIFSFWTSATASKPQGN